MTRIRLFLMLGVALLGAWAWPQDFGSASFFAPNRWAVVIGASDYTELGRLSFAASDAEAFASALIENYDFEPEKVKVLTDERESAEEKPTVARIHAVLDEVLSDRRVSQGDLLVFYFSGHGIGADGSDLLMPTDATKAEAKTQGLPVKSVIERIAKSGIRNVLFVADACRTGNENPFGTELVSLGREANIAVVLGCAPGGVSYELPQKGMGAMTSAFIDAMKDQALADEATGALWVSTLGEKVRAEVERVTEREQGREDRQIPSVYCRKNQDILLGGFVGRSRYAPELAEFIKAEGTTLDKEVYARLLHGLGLAAMEAGQSQAAVDALRTMRELGMAWSGSMAMEAVSLGWLGRDQEAGELFEQMVARYPDDYHSMLYRALYTVDHAARTAAGRAMWDKYKDVTSAMAWFVGVKADPSKGIADRVAILDAVIPAFVEESGPWQYFSAYRMGLTDDPRELLGDEVAVVDLPGVRREYVELLLFEVATRTGDAGYVLGVLQVLMENPVTRQVWEMYERPYALAFLQGEDRERAAGALLNAASSGERIWTAVCLWGSASGSHVAEIEAAAAKHPFSVRAQMALFLAKSLNQVAERIVIPEELRVLGLDRPEFVAEFYAQVSMTTTEPWTILFPDRKWRWNSDALRELIASPAPGLEEWWKAVAMSALQLQREDVLAALADRVDVKGRVSETWLEVAAGAYLYHGEPEKALAALKAFGRSESLTARAQWGYLEVYWLVRGELGQADLTVAERTALGMAPSTELAGLAAGLRAVLAGSAVAEGAFDLNSANPVVALGSAWGLAKSGTLPDEGLQEFVYGGTGGYPWIHAELVRLWAAKATGDDGTLLAASLLNFPDVIYASVPLPGGFDTKSGSYRMTGSFSWAGGPAKEVTFTVAWTDGKALCSVLEGGSVVMAFVGTVSSTGFLTVEGPYEGQMVRLRMRLLPEALWRTESGLPGVGNLLGADGSWGNLDVRPVFTAG